MKIELIFAIAAALVLITGWIAEKHVEDESWGKAKRFHQEVDRCYRKLLIRHRSPYCQIGWKP